MITETMPNSPFEAYTRIKENAKRMPKVRDCSGLKEGEVCRQGDVYLIVMPKGTVKKLHAVKSRQLVPGVTNGSRHIVAEDPKVKIWKSDPDLKWLENQVGFPVLPVQIGPCVESKDGFTLTHPSHPFCAKFPPGDVQVVYQVDAVTRQRAKD